MQYFKRGGGVFLKSHIFALVAGAFHKRSQNSIKTPSVFVRKGIWDLKCYVVAPAQSLVQKQVCSGRHTLNQHVWACKMQEKWLIIYTPILELFLQWEFTFFLSMPTYFQHFQTSPIFKKIDEFSHLATLVERANLDAKNRYKRVQWGLSKSGCQLIQCCGPHLHTWIIYGPESVEKNLNWQDLYQWSPNLFVYRIRKPVDQTSRHTSHGIIWRSPLLQATISGNRVK